MLVGNLAEFKYFKKGVLGGLNTVIQRQRELIVGNSKVHMTVRVGQPILEQAGKIPR